MSRFEPIISFFEPIIFHILAHNASVTAKPARLADGWQPRRVLCLIPIYFKNGFLSAFMNDTHLLQNGQMFDVLVCFFFPFPNGELCF
jgi:hypothetical protein